MWSKPQAILRKTSPGMCTWRNCKSHYCKLTSHVWLDWKTDERQAHNNDKRDEIELESSPQVDCCLRRELNKNESVINLLCGHLTHEGCVNDLLHAYSLEGCWICCDRSTNQQRIGELVNLCFSVHLIQSSDKKNWSIYKKLDLSIATWTQSCHSLTIALPILFLDIKKSTDMGVPELSRLQRERIACVMVRRQYVKDFQDQENAYIHTSEYRQIWTSMPYSF